MTDPAYYYPELLPPRTVRDRWVQIPGKSWSTAHLVTYRDGHPDPWTLCGKYRGGFDNATASDTVARCLRCRRTERRGRAR